MEFQKAAKIAVEEISNLNTHFERFINAFQRCCNVANSLAKHDLVLSLSCLQESCEKLESTLESFAYNGLDSSQITIVESLESELDLRFFTLTKVMKIVNQVDGEDDTQLLETMMPFLEAQAKAWKTPTLRMT